MKEIIDILNKKEEVIGNAPKKDVHSKHLLHYAAEIFIINNQGQILSQLRKSTKHHYPLHWGSSASGHVKTGETPEQGAYRELLEEIGIKTQLEFLGKFYFEDRDENQLVYVFTGSHNGPFSIQESELEKVKWFSKEEFENGYGLKMTPQSRFGIQLLIESKLRNTQPHYHQGL
jgi:isopentenyl-diphosphate delta-isomerase type 1